MRFSSDKGFSLAETIISIGILVTGVVAASGVLMTGVQRVRSSPWDVVASQKAKQAIESVFAARDSKRLTWSQIRNVSTGGIFLDGAQPLKMAGADGLVNTADDGAIETIDLPNHSYSLSNFTREIRIQDVLNESGQLRTITVTVTYSDGTSTKSYVLTTLISAYS